MKFYTLFSKTENVHLTKDVGMIPESLAATFPDIESYIVTYKNGEYPYVGKAITHAKLVFMDKQFGKCIDGIIYIIKNSAEIDVLNIYHLNLSSYLYALAAKKIVKKKIIIYLKLDAGPDEVSKLKKHSIIAWIKYRTIELADIVTAESHHTVASLQEICPKIKYLPNGCFSKNKSVADYTQKANRIITVGNIGTIPKNTELLVEAFSKAPNNGSWELRLIGPYTLEFKKWLSDFLIHHDSLRDKILLLGKITDKSILQTEYEKAKIFALPSRYESFGIVLLEALLEGDYILASKYVPAAYDMLHNQYAGSIVNEYSATSWSNALDKIMNKPIDWKQKCQDDFSFVNSTFDWQKIVISLRSLIDARI